MISVGKAQIEIDFMMDRTTLKEATLQLQRTFLTYALEQAKGNKSKAARILGMKRSTLCMMLTRLQKDQELPH